MRTYEGKYVHLEKKIFDLCPFDLIKCFKQIKWQRLLLTWAPISELPLNISIMSFLFQKYFFFCITVQFIKTLNHKNENVHKNVILSTLSLIWLWPLFHTESLFKVDWYHFVLEQSFTFDKLSHFVLQNSVSKTFINIAMVWLNQLWFSF